MLNSWCQEIVAISDAVAINPGVLAREGDGQATQVLRQTIRWRRFNSSRAHSPNSRVVGTGKSEEYATAIQLLLLFR